MDSWGWYFAVPLMFAVIYSEIKYWALIGAIAVREEPTDDPR